MLLSRFSRIKENRHILPTFFVIVLTVLYFLRILVVNIPIHVFYLLTPVLLTVHVLCLIHAFFIPRTRRTLILRAVQLFMFLLIILIQVGQAESLRNALEKYKCLNRWGHEFLYYHPHSHNPSGKCYQTVERISESHYGYRNPEKGFEVIVPHEVRHENDANSGDEVVFSNSSYLIDRHIPMNSTNIVRIIVSKQYISTDLPLEEWVREDPWHDSNGNVRSSINGDIKKITIADKDAIQASQTVVSTDLVTFIRKENTLYSITLLGNGVGSSYLDNPAALPIYNSILESFEFINEL